MAFAATRTAGNTGLNGIQSWRSVVTLTVTAGDAPNAPVNGILVDTDGAYGLQFADDTAPVTLPLKAGVVYPFVIRRVSAAAGNVYGGGS